MFRFFYMLCFLWLLLDVFRYGELCYLKMPLSLFLSPRLRSERRHQMKTRLKDNETCHCHVSDVIQCIPFFVSCLANRRFPQPTSRHVSFPGEP